MPKQAGSFRSADCPCLVKAWTVLALMVRRFWSEHSDRLMSAEWQR